MWTSLYYPIPPTEKLLMFPVSYMSVQICRDNYTYVCISVSIYVYMCVLVVQSCLTLWDPMDCACQAPLSMEFSRQEYWSGLPCPSSGDITSPGVKPKSPALQADSLTSEPPGKPIYVNYIFIFPSPFPSLPFIQMITFHLSHSGFFFFSHLTVDFKDLINI